LPHSANYDRAVPADQLLQPRPSGGVLLLLHFARRLQDCLDSLSGLLIVGRQCQGLDESLGPFLVPTAPQQRAGQGIEGVLTCSLRWPVSGQ
jgi:hypothetical protein